MYRTLANDILHNNKYLSIGTTNGKSSWVAPLYYCLGSDGCLYFCSQPSSRHIHHLSFSPIVSFAIFDSHAEEGKGNGVQGRGRVRKLAGTNLAKLIHNYHTTFFKVSPNTFTTGPYRLYQLRPEKIYVLNPEATVDQRVLVN